MSAILQCGCPTICPEHPRPAPIGTRFDTGCPACWRHVWKCQMHSESYRELLERLTLHQVVLILGGDPKHPHRATILGVLSARIVILERYSYATSGPMHTALHGRRDD